MHHIGAFFEKASRRYASSTAVYLRPRITEPQKIMGKIAEILSLAQARASELRLSYAGALTPKEAYALWQTAPGTRVVDVRTRAEWNWVGRIPGAIEIEWQGWPDTHANPNFLAELRQQADPESQLLFVCRSGIRSHHAAVAATEVGWTACYNVLEGFEGDKDANGQRGKLGGWRHAGLPWTS